jgi:proline dehydrogenase
LIFFIKRFISLQELSAASPSWLIYTLYAALPASLPAGRRLADRFIAGETLDDAVRAVRQLNAEGFEVTLDHLGESVSNPATAEEACRVYVGLLDRIAAERLRSHISIKLTQLGLAISEELAQRLLTAICEAAARCHNFVRIDMESSAYVDATLRLFRGAAAPRDVLGVVIQSYLFAASATLMNSSVRGFASGWSKVPITNLGT